MREHSADGGHRRGGQGVAVGVDADDALDLFCQHGHAVALLSDEDDRVVGVTLGGATAWQNCDESRRLRGGRAATDFCGVMSLRDDDV
ncbi:hypothetical protein [Streptomyces sp. R41]|uniref:CBS domain-containing protein n=1 Tax=Streptomyces sp. R41 TaxID=3238632 RepID=A0AB39RU78_9ACTN